MNRIGRQALAGTACCSAAAVAWLAGQPAAVAAGSIRAAYVESVIPSRSFADTQVLSTNARKTVGPGAGVFGVTSVTLTNFDTSAQEVTLVAAVLAGDSCVGGGPLISGTAGPGLDVLVQARSTLQLTFPSPLVFTPQGGITCVALQVNSVLHGGSVRLDVNGFVN